MQHTHRRAAGWSTVCWVKDLSACPTCPVTPHRHLLERMCFSSWGLGVPGMLIEGSEFTIAQKKPKPADQVTHRSLGVTCDVFGKLSFLKDIITYSYLDPWLHKF